jgi:hypothetical protein
LLIQAKENDMKLIAAVALTTICFAPLSAQAQAQPPATPQTPTPTQAQQPATPQTPVTGQTGQTPATMTPQTPQTQTPQTPQTSTQTPATVNPAPVGTTGSGSIADTDHGTAILLLERALSVLDKSANSKAGDVTLDRGLLDEVRAELTQVKATLQAEKK